MFKSKIEIREFAVKQAIELLGNGTPQKDVVEKAKEIEAYITGDAELPEVYSEAETVGNLLENAIGAIRDIMGDSDATGKTMEE